jgi:hypothetical protein
MKKIGKIDEELSKEIYHDWPLFQEFIATENFRKAYQEVFGDEFTSSQNEIKTTQ